MGSEGRVFRSVLAWICTLITAASASPSAGEMLKSELPAIYRFYADHNFIALNSTNEERNAILRALVEAKGADQSFPDKRLNDVRDALVRLMTAVASPDPRTIPRYVPYLDFTGTLTPVEITSRTKSRVVLKIEKRILPHAQLAVPAQPRFRPQAGEARFFSSSSVQYDYWLASGETWRTMNFHVFLIASVR
jgi:hypothetical protein